VGLGGWEIIEAIVKLAGAVSYFGNSDLLQFLGYFFVSLRGKFGHFP